MKIKLLIFFLGFITVSFGQSIFENSINDVNPNLSDPYTNGQTFDPNILVSGIGRGNGLNGNSANNRYNARDWNLTSFDPTDYFEFTITPNLGYKISLISFVYKAQVSTTGPTQFSFRSSLDGFTSIISSPVIPNSSSEVTPAPTDLSAAVFQNRTTPITFRIYGWGGTATTGTFSLNDFVFNGVVDCDLPVPVIGTLTQPTCAVSTGSIQLTGLPVGSWNLYQNGVLIIAGGTGSSTTVSGLTSGSYNYNISNAYCSSLVTGIVTINPTSTIWNGISWSGGLPDFNKIITFNGNYGSSGDLEACSCQVASGAVTINSGHSLKITNGISVSGGSITFEDDASLVQFNNVSVNSGNITYKRETTPISNLDYTYWSSPVASESLFNVSPLTLLDKFYSFNSGINNWQQENVSDAMAVGKGYIVRGPQNYMAPAPKNTYFASFIGQPNNGVINTPIGIAGNLNLIGNPYPSALDANAFLTANTGVLDGTIYFWTHNTNIGIGVSNPGSGTYAYSSDDYASYNRTGGVATQAPSSTNLGAVNSNAPSGKIASGQAFFVTSVAAGNAVFNNSMRVGVGGITGNNSQFFKVAANSKVKQQESPVERNRLWLNLSNSQDAFKQTLIGYISGATNEYDVAYDGESINSNAVIDFYSVYQNKNLVIQGRALPFVDNDEVQIGYSSNISGEFKISIGYIDGLLVNKKVYLEDKLLNKIQDLKKSSYAFLTEKGVFNDRFVVRYSNKTSIKDKPKDLKNYVSIISKRKEIEIKSFTEVLIDKVLIYNFSGKLLFEKVNISRDEYKISNLSCIDKLLIVHVTMQNGKSVIKKIIF